jgi:hypothetical protein
MSESMHVIRFTEYAGFDPNIFKAVEAGARMKADFSHVFGSDRSSVQSRVDLDGDGVAEFSIGRYGTEGVQGAQEGGTGMDFHYCRRTVVLGPQYSTFDGHEGSEWYPCPSGNASRGPAWKMSRLGNVTTWLMSAGARSICIGDECVHSDQSGTLKLSSYYGKLPGPLDFGSFVYVGDFNDDGLADFAVAHDLPSIFDRSYSIYLQVAAPVSADIEDCPY